ncbi:MAG: hypothetical protein ACK50P_22105 [Planctomycetaceae bacterium]
MTQQQSAKRQDSRPGIALVTRQTRLRQLQHRWGAIGNVQFNMLSNRRAQARQQELEQIRQAELEADAEFSDLQQEDHSYQQVVKQLQGELDFGGAVQMVDRTFLPNFDFSRFEVVVVVGQDGLVANAAKYVGQVPIVAVNPEPSRFDGVLLPFQVREARGAIDRVLRGQFDERLVTLAQVTLQDGQRLLAFNDLFVGAASHVSARYTLRLGASVEAQSSSGMIISTGAGSTGWMSSVLNMARGVAQAMGKPWDVRTTLNWEDRALLWAVREPFVSRTSQARLVFGRIESETDLVVESNMSTGGVIFSDGIESDFLEFNSGSIATVGVAERQARLVVR